MQAIQIKAYILTESVNKRAFDLNIPDYGSFILLYVPHMSE